MNHRNQGTLRRSLNIRGMKGAMTAFAGLIVIYTVFGAINPTVFPGQNVINLFRSTSKYLIIGIEQSYVLITGNIDLPIGSVVDMSTMITATLIAHEVNPMAAISIAPVCCLAIGVVSGILVGKFQLPPFIATLGAMSIARGVAYIVNGNRNTDTISSGIDERAADRFQAFFYYGKAAGMFNTFWIVLVPFAALFFLFFRTRTGHHIYAIDSNTEAARLSGVSVMATVIGTYLVNAFYSFVVGLTLYDQANMGNMEAGNIHEMYAAATGVIGGISPLGGTGILLGIFMDAAVWQIPENELDMVGVQVGIQRLVIGIIVVFAVFLGVVLRKGVLIRERPATEEEV